MLLGECVSTSPVTREASLWFSSHHLSRSLHPCRWILSTLFLESQVSPYSETNRSSRWIQSCACPRTSCRGLACSRTSSANHPTHTITLLSHYSHRHTHSCPVRPQPDYHGWMLGAERGPPHISALAEVNRHVLGFALHPLRTNPITQFWLDSSEPFCLQNLKHSWCYQVTYVGFTAREWLGDVLKCSHCC